MKQWATEGEGRGEQAHEQHNSNIRPSANKKAIWPVQ